MQYLNNFFSNAVSCNSIGHCIQQFWSNVGNTFGIACDTIYNAADGICWTCEQAVNQYRNPNANDGSRQFSFSNTIQRCANIVDQGVRNFCENVVTQWQPLVDSVLSAPAICKITGRCPTCGQRH